jgi:hypothetical protein
LIGRVHAFIGFGLASVISLALASTAFGQCANPPSCPSPMPCGATCSYDTCVSQSTPISQIPTTIFPTVPGTPACTGNGKYINSLPFTDDAGIKTLLPTSAGSGATFSWCQTTTVTGAGCPVCGDGMCNGVCTGSENCSTCPGDCGGCPCTPNASQACVGNTVYWFDSCGIQGGGVVACSDSFYCSAASCLYNPACTPTAGNTTLNASGLPGYGCPDMAYVVQACGPGGCSAWYPYGCYYSGT